MKKKFINGFFMVALLFVAMGSFVSCKDTDEDAIAELKAELQNQNATLKQLIEAQVKTLQDQISALETAKNECQKQCNEVKDRLSKLEGNYADLKANYEQKIKELEVAIAKLDGVLDAIAGLKKDIGNINDAIGGLEDEDIRLAQLINDVNKVAAQAAADASTALALAQKNEIDITNLTATVNTIKSTIVGWGERLTAVELAAATAQSTADAALKLAKENKEKLDNLNAGSSVSLEEAKKYTDDAIKALKGNATMTLGELQKAFGDYVDDNDERLDDIEDDIEYLQDQIDDIYDVFKNLVEILEQAITSIIVQGTVNPLIGYMNMPLDMRSTMLAAFCGEAGSTNNVVFPSGSQAAFVDPSQCPKSEERNFLKAHGVGYNDTWKIASAGGYVYDCESKDNMNADDSQKRAYAGTLYLTINPNTVNYTGELQLMDSQDNESGMKLYSLKKSDYKLTFGWTKAADNGFYEAKAYVNESDIPSLAARIDFNAIKDVAKDLLDNKNGVDLTQMATTIYTTFSNILDAYAVKATYKTPVWDETTKTTDYKLSSTYSNYNLALTTIKPLSYRFNVNGLPLDILSRRFATIDNVVITFDQDINIDINLDDIETTPNVSGTVNIPSMDIIDEHGNVVGKTEATQAEFHGTAELDEILGDLVGSISGQMENQVDGMINDLLDQVNGKINTYISQANNVVNKVNSVLDSFENFVKTIDSKLQPTMFFSDASGNYHKASEAWLVPTKLQMSGSGDNAVKLTATSYTAELLAPACKKLVCVSNVVRYDNNGNKFTAQNGDPQCQAAMDYANGKGLLGGVVSGTVRDFALVTKGDYANYIYEVSYFALDFSGVQSRTKYYIQPVR